MATALVERPLKLRTQRHQPNVEHVATALVERPLLRAEHRDELDDVARERPHVVVDVGELRDATRDEVDRPTAYVHTCVNTANGTGEAQFVRVSGERHTGGQYGVKLNTLIYRFDSCANSTEIHLAVHKR